MPNPPRSVKTLAGRWLLLSEYFMVANNESLPGANGVSSHSGHAGAQVVRIYLAALSRSWGIVGWPLYRCRQRIGPEWSRGAWTRQLEVVQHPGKMLDLGCAALGD